MKISIIFGTRPEAIKLAPVILTIRKDARFVQIVESARALILAERPKAAPAIQAPQ